MIDFTTTYARFQEIKATMIGLEDRMLNHGGSISSTDHSMIVKLMQMVEDEAESVLSMLLRMRGNQPVVRKHGKASAMSFTAGIDPTTDEIVLTMTDKASNTSEAYFMPKQEFERLLTYFHKAAGHDVTGSFGEDAE